MADKKKKPHYVNNKEFLQAMVEWKAKCREAEKAGKPQPPITNYIGECFLKIANHLSYRPNFINYTYRDEMISDGIENCVNYIGNFNPEKSTNPFAYFTQIIYYAFLRRIQREKKQLYIKHKSLERSIVFDELSTHTDGASQGDQGAYINLDTPYMTDFVQNFEKKEAEKKELRKKKKGLENFVEDNNDGSNTK